MSVIFPAAPLIVAVRAVVGAAIKSKSYLPVRVVRPSLSILKILLVSRLMSTIFESAALFVSVTFSLKAVNVEAASSKVIVPLKGSG